jgi:glycosyltransferase involved in cell wall biosynthesis
MRSVKILIAHNRYQQRGGEDSVVDAEIALLRQHGHTVHTYHRDNDELPSLSAREVAASVLWSTRTRQEVGALCDRLRPDVLHAHNTFPLISPSLYWTASKHGIPVVQTLHNFRLLCPQAIFLRDGAVCEDCLGRAPWRGVLHRCYHDHRLQSAAVASMLTLHRMAGSYESQVTRYIALNAFCREKFIAGGLPPLKLCIKPNFIDAPWDDDAAAGDVQGTVRCGGLYVGRLSAEKGIEVLIGAYALGGLAPIVVIGDGPLLPAARAQFGAGIRGALPLDAVLQSMRTARYLVAPSICFETGPRAIVEAFASGLPVIASRHGAMGEMVQDGVTGLLFRAGDALDLHAKLQWADRHPKAMAEMGHAACAEYARRYTAQRNYVSLIAIYRAAIDDPEPGQDALIEPAGNALSPSAAIGRTPVCSAAQTGLHQDELG